MTILEDRIAGILWRQRIQHGGETPLAQCIVQQGRQVRRTRRQGDIIVERLKFRTAYRQVAHVAQHSGADRNVIGRHIAAMQKHAVACRIEPFAGGL
jgi:hypothetical protein